MGRAAVLNLDWLNKGPSGAHGFFAPSCFDVVCHPVLGHRAVVRSKLLEVDSYRGNVGEEKWSMGGAKAGG